MDPSSESRGSLAGFYDLQARFLQCLQLAWIVRDNLYFAPPRIERHLSAFPIISRVNRQIQTFVCFYCIGAFILKCIGANLVQDSNPASLLLLIADREIGRSSCMEIVL